MELSYALNVFDFLPGLLKEHYDISRYDITKETALEYWDQEERWFDYLYEHCETVVDQLEIRFCFNESESESESDGNLADLIHFSKEEIVDSSSD